MSDLRDPFFAPNAVSLDEMEQLQTSGMGSLRRGWETGRIGAERNALGVDELAARSAGDLQRAEGLRAQNEALAQRQGRYAPEVGRVEDITGIGTGLDWAAGQFGQGLASMAEPVAAATVLGGAGRLAGMLPGAAGKVGRAIDTIGGPAAAFGINQRQMAGEFANNAMQDQELMARTSPQDLYRTANIVGAAGGAMDTVLPSVIGRQLTGGALRAGIKGMGPAAKTALGMLGEGGTELTQGEIGRYALGQLNPNRDVSEDPSNRLNEALGGAVGGGPLIAAGAYADAGFRRMGHTAGQIGTKAGEVYDLAKEQYEGSALERGVDAAGTKAKGLFNRGKDEVIDLYEAAKDEDGKVNLGKAVDMANERVRQQAEEFLGQPLQGGKLKLDDDTRNALAFGADPSVPAPQHVLDSQDPDATQKWYAEGYSKRGQTALDILDELAANGDQTAESLAQRIAEEGFNSTAADEGVLYVQQAAAESEKAEFRSTAEAGYAVAGKLGAMGARAIGKGAVKVGKGALKIGKDIWSAGKDELSKKNAQGEELSAYAEWRERTGRAKADMDSLDIQNAEVRTRLHNSMPAERKAQEAIAQRRAEAMGEILVAEAQALDETPAVAWTVQGLGFELADIAASWGMNGPKQEGAVGLAAGTRQMSGLTMTLDNAARALKVVYGDKAIGAVDQLRAVADAGAGPMFDYLAEQIKKVGTAAGRAEMAATRKNVANQMMQLVPADQVARMQASGGDYREKFLRAIETIANGVGDPGLRKAFERELGKDTIDFMVASLNNITPESKPKSGSMFGDSPDTGVEDDFERAAAEKNVSAGAGQAVYGFHATSTFRGGNRRIDPFAADIAAKDGDKLAAQDEALQRKADGERGGNLGKKRPTLFKQGQKLFGGEDAIGKKIADLEKYLGVDQTPERMAKIMEQEGNKAGAAKVKELMARGDEKAQAALKDGVKSFFVNRAGNYKVGAKSAKEVMDGLGYQPGKVLSLYRDYLRQENKGLRANKVAQAVLALSEGEKEGRTPRMSADEVSKIVAEAEKYFSERFLVVAEGLSDRVPDKMSVGEVMDLVRDASKALDNIDGAVRKRLLAAGLDADKDSKEFIDARNEMISEGNFIFFTTTDKMKNKDGTESYKRLPIKVSQLVGWAKAQKAQYETDVPDETGKEDSFKNTDKDMQFLENLLSGINAVRESGHTKQDTPPYMFDKFGRPESFEKGIPPSLQLATTTQFQRERVRDERAEAKREQVGPPNPMADPTSDQYRAKVERDQDKDEGFVAEQDRGAEGVDPYQLWGDLREVTRVAGKQTGDGRTMRAVKDESSEKRTGDYKTTETDRTPLDFFGKQKEGEAPDEFADALYRTKRGGKSVYDPLPFETASDAARKAEDRSGPILQALRGKLGTPEQGLNQIIQRIKAAETPYTKDGPAGGIQYLYPAAAALNPGVFDAELDGGGKMEDLNDHLKMLRGQVFRVLRDGDIAPKHKVAITRLLVGEKHAAKVTAANVNEIITKRAAPDKESGLDYFEAKTPLEMKDVSKKPIEPDLAPRGSSREVTDDLGRTRKVPGRDQVMDDFGNIVEGVRTDPRFPGEYARTRKYADEFEGSVDDMNAAIERKGGQLKATKLQTIANLAERARESAKTKAAPEVAAKQAPKSQSKPSGAVNVWYSTGENAQLSNLAARPFTLGGKRFHSVEHAYQSWKSGEFDQGTYDRYTGGGQKIAGNKGTKTESGWNLRLMKRLVSESFKQNPEAAKALSATGDARITHTQDRGVWATEFPRILTEVRDELKPQSNPGGGRDLGTLPMYYKMPPHGVRQDLRAQYPNGTTTAQLMADGHRTATTRRAFGAVGDTFTVAGRKYRITALEQVDMDSAAGREKWAQREGWDVDYIQQHGSGQVRTGAVQTVFERVGAPKSQGGQRGAGNGITITAHQSSGYRERTKHNADSAGLTVAIATNYTTAGERLTKSVAGDKYLAIPLDVAPEKGGVRLAKAMRQLDTTTLNVAGNGIYTLAPQGFTQASVNQHVYDLIAAAHALRPITKIVTGGQTGVDLAGAVAAHKLGIPVVVTMPKGFVQRDAQGRDATHTVSAIERQIVDGAAALIGGAADWSDTGARKLNAMSTKIHNDLQRPGFAATHDSPIKHEGKFDWRSHQGKGEGNAAFGAGTYLSTADGVHRSYKDQFTARARRDGRGFTWGGVEYALWEDEDYKGSYLIERSDGGVMSPTEEALAHEILANGRSPEEAVNALVDSAFAVVDRSARDLVDLMDVSLPSSDFQEAADALAAKMLARKHLTKKDVGEFFSRWVKVDRWNRMVDGANKRMEAIRNLDTSDIRVAYMHNNSPTYQVSVNIKPEELLDWDKPLDEQSELVRKALEGVKRQMAESIAADLEGGAYDARLAYATEKMSGAPGKGIYGFLTERLGSQAAASDYLQSLGILGHKYAASGGKNDTHPNYVIYDDSKITTNYVHFNKQGEPMAGWKAGPTAKAMGAPASDREMAQAQAYVKKVLGPKFKLMFEKDMGHSGEFIEAENLIKIAIGAAAGTMPTAYHEALHAFFASYLKSDPRAMEVMKSLAENQTVLDRITALLDGYPAAQAQLTSGEERLAYIFQFYAAGQLDLPSGKGRNWVQKLVRYFRKVLGTLRADERATDILDAFHDGKFSDPSTAQRVLAKLSTPNSLSVKARRNLDGLIQGAAAAALPAQAILNDSPSRTAKRLMRTFYANPGSERDGKGGEGYLNAVKSERTRRNNVIMAALEEGGATERDMKAIVTYLQQGVDPIAEAGKIPYAPHRKAVAKIRAELEDFHHYMTSKGLDVGYIQDYFPVIWNSEALAKDPTKFAKMLVENYPEQMGKAIDGTNLSPMEAAMHLATLLTDRAVFDGKLAPGREDGVLIPFFESSENRTLDWIKPEHREPWLSKELLPTLTKYFGQGVRAAEYVERFGEKGEKLDHALKLIDQELSAEGAKMVKAGKLKDAEAGNKWAARQYRDVRMAVGAMEGTLGKNISDTHRSITSWVVVYQNIRLLPLSLFASVVDPLSIVARGGDFKLAGEVFINGMKEVFKGWREVLGTLPPNQQKNEWEQMAEFIGATESAMMAHFVSEEYSSQYMSPRAKKINDMMFKLNGMESWNRAMRVGATKGAAQFLIKHKDLPDAQHSKRWLKELGLTPEDIIVDNGKLVVDKHELAALRGMSLEEADAKTRKVQFAMNRWIEGAVLTPNSAQRPAWSSDPRWSFIFHLKQFTYSFQQTILTRAWNEMKQGNLAPMGSLSLFIPAMIASDMTKGLIVGGGELPPYMQGYNAADWVGHGLERAGTLGYGQLALDAVQGPASLGGPMAEQIVDAFRQPLGDTLLKAMPANALYRNAIA